MNKVDIEFEEGNYYDFKNNNNIEVSKNTENIISERCLDIYSNLSNWINNIENRLNIIEKNIDKLIEESNNTNIKILYYISNIKNKFDILTNKNNNINHNFSNDDNINKKLINNDDKNLYISNLNNNNFNNSYNNNLNNEIITENQLKN